METKPYSIRITLMGQFLTRENWFLLTLRENGGKGCCPDIGIHMINV